MRLVTEEAVTGQGIPQIVISFSEAIGEKPDPLIYSGAPPRYELITYLMSVGLAIFTTTVEKLAFKK
jgi:hypothetical protein